MPYLKEDRRRALNEGAPPETGADLDYVFCDAIDRYHDEVGVRAENIITVLGALDGAKLEYYRRVAAGYEQSKVLENGDVFVRTAKKVREAISGLASRLKPGTTEQRMENMTAGARAAKPNEVESGWANEEERKAIEQAGGVQGISEADLGEWGK